MLLATWDPLLGKFIKIVNLKQIFNYFSWFFSGSDPNQHILDTLEQCISVIIEKLHRLDQDKNDSRLSSMEYSKPIEGEFSFLISRKICSCQHCDENVENVQWIENMENSKNS